MPIRSKCFIDALGALCLSMNIQGMASAGN